jgi:tripartite-type tricarboxylate transporter receptor subunit TctC
MKSLLNKVLAVVFLVTSTLTYAQPKEDINIVWGFNIGSAQANVLRTMVSELNKTQSKYNFTLVHRPGAGGTIAANAVSSNPQNTVVGMSSSFIIRPNYERKDVVQDLDKFVPLFVQGTGSPLVFVSKKYSSFDQVLKSPNLTVGVSGVGSISHLAANELASVNKNIIIANFKNMMDAATAAAGGHVDVAVAFPSDIAGLIESNHVTVLAYTGRHELVRVDGVLAHKFKLDDLADLTANYAIYASVDMDKAKYNELYKLISSVNNNEEILNGYKKDFVTVAKIAQDKNKSWYQSERVYWKKRVDNINASLVKE